MIPVKVAFMWMAIASQEAPTYVCAKIAYLRGQKSQYPSAFIAYLRRFLRYSYLVIASLEPGVRRNSVV